jgi:hypothetical protein
MMDGLEFGFGIPRSNGTEVPVSSRLTKTLKQKDAKANLARPSSISRFSSPVPIPPPKDPRNRSKKKKGKEKR